MNKLLTMISAAAFLTAFASPAYADHHGKTVFVTNSLTNGHLGGLAGADAMCQAEADEPASIVSSGIYLAWISDGEESPDTRFTKSSDPYVLPDGTNIADSYVDLTDGSILHPLNIDATGNTIGFQEFWTGTISDGTSAPSSVTCNGWTADPEGIVYYGMAGRTNQTSGAWTSFAGRTGCPKQKRLACFQQ
jgi:hypothetical protein